MDWVYLDAIKISGSTVHRLYKQLNGKEQLRIMVAREPIEATRLTYHVSASIGEQSMKGSTRKPTDDEMKLVRKYLFLSLPGVLFEEDNECGVPRENVHVRHLWEVKG